MGLYTVLMVVHSVIVLFLIMFILLQRTDSDGMGGLGGGGGNQFLTGRASANLMTRTTAILAGAFMLSSLVLAVLANRMTSHSILDNTPAAVEGEAPAKELDRALATKDKADEKAPAVKKAVPVQKDAPVENEAPAKKEEAPAAPSVPKPE